MFFSSLVGILAPIVMSLLATHELLQAEYFGQRCQIAADNAMIYAGRAQRQILKRLASVESTIVGIEKAHHVAHLCAKSGEPNCLAADTQSELAIRAAIALAEVQTRGAWTLMLGEIARELTHLEASPFTISIGAAPPLISRRCRTCGLQVGWDLDLRRWVGKLTVCIGSREGIALLAMVRSTDGNTNYQLQ